MSLYTLLISTILNVNKELPIQSGLTLEECKASAMSALSQGNNFARCLPPQPEKPFILVKLPSGLIVEVIRKNGGYSLSPEYSIADRNFLATALGKPSSGVHSLVHGPAKDLNNRDKGKALTSE